MLTSLIRHCLGCGCVFGLVTGILFASSEPISAAEITKTEGVFFEPDLIKITGLIEFEDFPAFARIASTTSNTVVVLDSPGGKVGPTFDIAMLAKARGFSTYVESGATCHSGCANIWLSGYRKFVERGGKLGFHPSSSVQDGERVPGSNLTSALMGWYYAQLGMPRELVIQIFELDPLTITEYDPEVIRDLGIDMTIRDPGSLQAARAELGQALSSGTRMNVLTQILLRESTRRSDATVEMKSTKDLAMMMASGGFQKLALDPLDNGTAVSQFLSQDTSTILFIYNPLKIPLNMVSIETSDNAECPPKDKSADEAILKMSEAVPPRSTAAIVLDQSKRDLLFDSFGEYADSCLKLSALVP